MSNDAKSPDNSGEDAIKLVSDFSHQGISVDQLLKGMSQPDVISFLISQYNTLKERYEGLEQQLKKLESLLKSDHRETAQRIERILALMTSNLTFIKQMIQLEDANNDKLTEQEKLNNRQELQAASFIERQNQLSVSLATMDKNNHIIMDEIAKLKTKDLEHDQFEFKVMTVASVVSAIIFWLMTGDNLAKLTVFLSSLTGHK